MALMPISFQELNAYVRIHQVNNNSRHNKFLQFLQAQVYKQGNNLFRFLKRLGL